jgi:flavin reductase (DIM6/NTAB) family NADH-FMN oxidoreductase RutF
LSFSPLGVVWGGGGGGGQANFMPVGWISRVNFQPPMLAISLAKTHYTCEGIREHKQFSVNVPGLDLLGKVDYCGLVSGKEADKAKLFSIFYSGLEYAPLISECRLCLACTLVQTVSLATNDLFLGEIVEACAEGGVLIEGNPDVARMQPFTLTMPDNTYWKIGEKAGKAWEAGRNLMK